jgi:hypothetical protein
MVADMTSQEPRTPAQEREAEIAELRDLIATAFGDPVPGYDYSTLHQRQAEHGTRRG